jgi:non-homologous end joining protein Ku
MASTWRRALSFGLLIIAIRLYPVARSQRTFPHQLHDKALEDTGRVGIAQVTMHQREYRVLIPPRNHGITVPTMYFQNEIREVQA